MKDLKQKTIRGGFSRLCAQAGSFLIRVGSLMVLSRPLGPKDFGLVGMVTAFTGVLNLFRDFGLSSAAVQRENVTEEQISTLFWINLLVSALLGLVALAMAPAIAIFYHEPRLVGVTAVLAAGFLFNGAGVQHSVLLQREMRFTALALISTLSLIAGTAVAIIGVKAGYGYRALVMMTVTLPLTSTVLLWLITGWVPGMPRRGSGIRSMIRFGGSVTLNGLVAYVAYNLEKILLGRFWGADAIGIYGRSYQLVNIPTDNLNAAVGEVAFSALSRVQADPVRFKSYFLKGYSLVLSFTIPITIVSALFADDVIRVLLGPKWVQATAIFRLLAPTILIFAIINPLGWLLYSLGLVRRSLRIALVFAPLIIVGYVIGLPYGPKGVAFGYSVVMLLWVFPHIALCVRGTVISFRDILLTAGPLVAIGLVAGGGAFAVRLIYGGFASPLARLIMEGTLVLFTFFLITLFAPGQRSLYINLLRGLKAPSSGREASLVSA